MKLLKEADIKNKRVIVRVDFNVPLNPQGEIIDDARIKASLPTIKYLLNGGAKQIILISHLGRPVVRPKEKVQNIILGNRNLLLEPIALCLAKWLKNNKKTFNSVDFPESPLPLYKILPKLYLMENIRFLSGETRNDTELGKTLAGLGDIFVNDAFGASHRAHASIVAIAQHLPSYAGLSLIKEIENLEVLLKNPPHPFILVLGGAKISDKILTLKHLIKKVDYVLLGGVMANTFLATRGVDLKKSLVAKDALPIADELMSRAAKKIILPVDLIWDRQRVVDIGKGTIGQYQHYLQKAQTVFFNGTMGLTSLGMEKYKRATIDIIKIIANLSGVRTMICGGDTIAEVNKLKLANKFTFISTGGGATLEFLAGEKLPGLEALK